MSTLVSVARRPLAASSTARPERSTKQTLRARLRQAFVIDFSGLDRLDLGDEAAFDAYVSDLFSRGGHTPAARA